VKIEGQVVFDFEWVDTRRSDVRYRAAFAERMARMPPMVARCLFVADDVLWSPLWNAPRCVRKLMSEGSNKSLGPLGRDDEEEYTLRVSAFMSLKMNVWWHQRGIVYSPTVEMLIRNGWYTPEIKQLVISSVAAAWRQAQMRCPASWNE
jgi:hypothetical protein